MAPRLPAAARPKLPHRLDRVMRGVLLVALTPEAIAFHNEQIRARRWKKYYLARVYEPQERSVASLLGLHKAHLKRVRHRAQVVRSGGKPSFLEILAAHPAPDAPDQVHVLVKLLTGRFHQVRAMLADLGAPLVGDVFYGGQGKDRADFYLEHILLKYTDYAHHTPRVAHLRDDLEGDRVAPAMQAESASLLD